MSRRVEPSIGLPPRDWTRSDVAIEPRLPAAGGLDHAPGVDAPVARDITADADLDRISEAPQLRRPIETGTPVQSPDWAALFDQSPIMQAVLTLDGDVIAANDQAVMLSGWPREVLIGQPFWDAPCWNPDEINRAQGRHLINVAAAGVISREQRSCQLLDAEGQLQQRSIELTLTPLRDAHGRVVHLQVIGVDISELENRWQEISDQGVRLFESTLQALPSALFICEAPSGRLMYANEPFDALWRQSVQPVMSFDDYGQWRGYDAEGRRYDNRQWPMARAILSGDVVRGEHVEIERGDGSRGLLRMSAAPVRDNTGQILAGVVICDDITELRQLELAHSQAQVREAAAVEASQLKSAFLSSMSHEIRTPMNAIIGMTSILLDTALSAEQRDSAEVIRSSGEHLLTVINDILDYSKIEAGRMQLEYTTFSLHECIETSIDLVAGSAQKKNVELGYLIAAGLPDTLLGDSGRLRQVLVNLLSNAVKFTPDGGQVSIEVHAQALADQAYQIMIDVRDTGIGIDPAVLPTLFNAFTQADASTTRRFGGTGLGLSISKRLVELMGGEIGAESEPGVGSVFRFSFRTEAVALQQRVAASTLSSASLRGRRVLIVDDIEINQRILRHYAEQWGMTPVCTTSPIEALNWVQRGDAFDFALLDFNMPAMDGMQLSRALRELRSEAELPILILSSAAQEVHEPGVVSGIVMKPIKPSRLLEEMNAVLLKTTAVRPAASASYKLPHDLGERHPLRILVAEDNAVNQKVARLLLQRLGYNADFVGDGREAVTSVERQTYDLVLLDVQMPVMDGLSAAREITQRWPTGQRPRLVAMTANATLEDRRACEASGMDDYIAKPVAPERLVDALQRCPRRDDLAAIDEDRDFNPDMVASVRATFDDEGLQEIVAALVLDLPRQQREIALAIEQRQSAPLIRQAHTMRGNCEMFGALQLAALCRQVELRAAVDLDTALTDAGPMLSRYQTLVQRLNRLAPIH